MTADTPTADGWPAISAEGVRIHIPLTAVARDIRGLRTGQRVALRWEDDTLVAAWL